MTDARHREVERGHGDQPAADPEQGRDEATAEADQDVAKVKGVIRREEAASLKIYKLAEAEAEAARIKAENGRSDAAMALEAERIRLERLPAILSEVVKPAEKIKGISINHISGLDRSGGGGTGAPSPVSQTIDSILDMRTLFEGIPLDRIHNLVGLLQGVGRDATEVLFLVPRAAALGIAQARHDVEQGLDGGSLGVGLCHSVRPLW